MVRVINVMLVVSNLILYFHLASALASSSWLWLQPQVFGLIMPTSSLKAPAAIKQSGCPLHMRLLVCVRVHFFHLYIS